MEIKMKFYNTVTSLSIIDQDFTLINNTSSQSALVITIQIINNEDTDITVKFRRKNSNDEYTPYVSTIIVKPGTTILDHLMVIQPNTKYVVSSNSSKTVISCSYGI